jgi:hypothetical protein
VDSVKYKKGTYIIPRFSKKGNEKVANAGTIAIMVNISRCLGAKYLQTYQFFRREHQ